MNHPELDDRFRPKKLDFEIKSFEVNGDINKTTVE